MKCFFYFHKLVSKPSVQEPISLDVIRKHALLTLKCLWYLIVKYIYILMNRLTFTNKTEILNLIEFITIINNTVKLRRRLKSDCVNSTRFKILQ